MAKRLNKKVVLIGSVVLLLLVLVAVAAVLRLGRDPEKFIRDGDAAWQAKDYDKAERSYLKAYKLARPGQPRIDMLFKLADLYIETDKWPKVYACWQQIINIDTKNVKAGLSVLKYLYIRADSYARTGGSGSQVWSEVESKASEAIKVVENAGLLGEERAKWEPAFGKEDRSLEPVPSRTLGSYLYLIRGRAALELGRMGAVTSPEQFLDKAMNDLQKVQQLDPQNVDAYLYLAEVTTEKGQILASRGNVEEKEKAAKGAEELLQKAVEVAGGGDPRAHIKLLSNKLKLAQSSETVQAKQQIQALEPGFTALVNKFPSSAEAFAALSEFYYVYSMFSAHESGLKNLDKAVEAMTKAIELDKENVVYATSAANLYYCKFSVHGQKSEVFKAIELAKNALALPNVKDTAGPRSHAVRTNRFRLRSFLANCYIEQILEPSQEVSQSQAAAMLADAGDAVHEIEQIFGGGEEDPQVLKWQGMLALAKGQVEVAKGQVELGRSHINSAIQTLYEAYQRIKASKVPGRRDAELSYTLAKIFMDTSELGAVKEFLEGALNAGIAEKKTEAVLDYADVALKLRDYRDALDLVNFYEKRYWTNERSQTLRIKVHIAANEFDEAEEALAGFAPDDPNTIRLRLALADAKIGQLRSAIAQRQIREDSGSILQPGQVAEKQDLESDAAVKLMKGELDKYKQQRADLVAKLLAVQPDSVDEATVTKVCSDLISVAQTSRAENIAGRFLAKSPNSGAVLFYKKLLSEPEPANVSDQRRKEIEKQALSGIADPVQQALELGIFYRRNNEPDKAIGQFKKVLETQVSPEQGAGRPAFKLSDQVSPQRIAAGHLFGMATNSKNWQLAEQVVETVRRENLDDCEGQLFAARLAVAKSDFQDALAKINECLKQKPIFSRAYMLRSNINAALNNEHASLEDVQRAASLNPLDGVIAKGLADALYRRNIKLADSASAQQVNETTGALLTAMRLNPGDLTLPSLYAEYISPTDPNQALAIRQTLQRSAPSLQNAILLAKLAIGRALKENDEGRRQSLFQIAASSLDEARRSNPQDRVVLETYADYYQAQGQNQKAEQLLLESKDQPLLWRHYFSLGQFEDAGKILQQLYARQPKDTDVIRGLFLVAAKTADQEGIKRYSQELVSLQDNAQNRLDQIKAYLKVGLIKEAEYKLQSFKEKYPEEADVLLLEGWLAMRQGQLKTALELMNRNLEAQQDNAAAWRLRGEINLLMANYDQAIIDLRRSMSLSSTPDARFALARAYDKAGQAGQAGREDDAITELRSTIDLPGAPPEARSLLEQIYLKLGRKEALKKFYEETLQKFPQNAFWYIRAGGFAMAVGEFDKAEQLYQKAYLMKRQVYLAENLEAGWRDVQYAMALDGYLQALVLGAGDPNTKDTPWRPEKLNKVFEESGKYRDTPFAPVAYYRTAEARFKLGDKDAAIEYCRKAVDQAGTNERLASEILLRMFLLVGEQEVSKYCQQRLQTDPNSQAANFTMFNLAKIRGEYDMAADYIDKCIQIAGSDTPRGLDYTVKKAEVLTLAYEKTSDNNYLKKAIRDYESLLVKMPNNTTVLNNLAYMLTENNERLPDALEYAKQALEQTPNNPVFLDTYAYVLYKSGTDSKADEFMTAALQQYEQNELVAPPDVYEHKGMIKERLGQKKQALDAYKRALEIGADKLSKPAKDRITSAVERLSR
jgi:tetratricopeptide (TPR) repeat protein